MAAQLNHTIVHCRDPWESATFLAEMLDLPAPVPFGPFLGVETGNGVTLDYMRTDDDIAMQHYAFLVTEEEFDQIYGRILERGLDHYADPGGTEKGQINHKDGGRGVYWAEPSGHWLEIITVPYGGWPS
jgi:hypothetical protein